MEGKFKGDIYLSGSTSSDPLFVASAWTSLPWKRRCTEKVAVPRRALSCFYCLMQFGSAIASARRVFLHSFIETA